MKFTIEVIADTREDATVLVREAAIKIKRGKEASGENVNHCIGDYRITTVDEPEPATPYIRNDGTGPRP